MEPTTCNNVWPPNQAGFDNPFINDFIYLGILKMSFGF